MPDVLVVDDDEDIRVSLDRGLRLSGFAVRTAADGEAALLAVAGQRPDCIVLDVGLPGRDGIAVVEAGKLGTKTGAGFLDVPAERTPELVAYRNKAYVAMKKLIDELGPAPIHPAQS